MERRGLDAGICGVKVKKRLYMDLSVSVMVLYFLVHASFVSECILLESFIARYAGC
jgi:hypothetical protein